MKLSKLFEAARLNYLQKKDFDGNQPAYLSFVKELPSAIKSYIESLNLNQKAYIVEGSAGKGKWTDNPWIGIFDPKITSKASSGFYIVFLFSDDQKRVALALANSVTDVSQNVSRQDLENQELPKSWVASALPQGFLNKTSGSLGGKYEKAVVLHKTYVESEIENAQIEKDLSDILAVYSSIVKNKKIEAKKCWVLGATWEDEDKSKEFLENGIWQNGFSIDSGDPSLLKVMKVNVGDLVAMKSSFPRAKEAVLRIKAVGTVKRNHNDGITLDVEWYVKGPPFDITGTSYRSTIDEVKNEEVRRLIFFNDFKATKANFSKVVPEAIALPTSKNTVLVGPPGVGKTLAMLKLQKRFSSQNSISADLSQWIEELKWWEVVAVVLHELGGRGRVTEILEHEYLKIKINQSNSKKPRQVIWSVLQSHTVMNSPTVMTKGKSEPLIFDKADDSVWKLVGNQEDLIQNLISQKAISEEKISKRYEFVTFHQSFSYEDFVEGIRPVIDENAESLKYELSKGAFRRISERAISDPENDYAIFIDEINRGNISKIFGELITLIEDDKRLGARNEVTVTLPYSKQEFGVPKNLYIIASMNSADRSITPLDSALRRRFRFINFLPDENLIPEEIDGIPLRAIMIEINKRISAILGPELQIGHGFFLSDRCDTTDHLNAIWCTKIMPQLHEHFFDDVRKLEYILGPWLQRIELSKDSEFSNRSLAKYNLLVLRTPEEFKERMLKLDQFLRAA